MSAADVRARVGNASASEQLKEAKQTTQDAAPHRTAQHSTAQPHSRHSAPQRAAGWRARRRVRSAALAVRGSWGRAVATCRESIAVSSARQHARRWPVLVGAGLPWR
eukprot:6208278-Pleurochrysis_carterae.AAC.4